MGSTWGLMGALFATDWPEAAMRGHSMALSGLLAALLVMVVRGQDYSGTMQCQCECASDCTSGDSVTCDCPEPAFACAPGFTQVKCGKVKYQCKMTVTYMDDCSTVSKVAPSCTPKKSKCTKGVSVSIETANGCTVTGKYKNTGKKQSMSGLGIDGFVTAAPTTTAIPTTVGPTAAPGETQ